MWFINNVPAVSESDLLILDILGDDDYRRFQRILSYLDYSTPGEYLDIEIEENDSILNNPSLYFKSSFFVRHKRFMSGSAKVPLIGDIQRDWRKSRYKSQEKELFEKLTFEMFNREFLSMENSTSYLELRVSRYKNFCNYLATKNINAFHYLSHMEMLLQKRKQMIQYEGITEEESSIFYPIAFPLISDIVKFEQFCNQLHKSGFISDIDAFKSVFLSKRKHNQLKVKWNKNNLSLLFTIELLQYKKKIEESNLRSKQIVKCFLDKNYKSFKEDSLNSQANKNGLTSMNQKLLDKINNDDNSELKLVYTLFKEVYKEV